MELWWVMYRCLKQFIHHKVSIPNLSIYNQLNRFFNDFERCDEPFPWIVFVALVIVNLTSACCQEKARVELTG